MFEVCIISENTFSQFEKSLWLEKENVLNLLTFKKISDLNTGLGDIFNPEFKLEKLNLNTVDVLYTRTHTYQLIYGYEGNENYVSSVLNYKRNKISGLTVIVKFKIFNNDKEIKYQEESISNDDFINILRDMYYHKGFHISSNILLNEIEYDNKESILLDFKDINQITIMGIPFKIWYKEGNPTNPLLKCVGYYLDKKISDVYITCAVYLQKKCLSLDDIMVKQFIDLISLYPDENEIKDLEKNYSIKNKDVRSDNIFILFEEFYWSVKNN
jgi:hypothetical protein